jgi:hypothetical protein
VFSVRRGVQPSNRLGGRKRGAVADGHVGPVGVSLGIAAVMGAWLPLMAIVESPRTEWEPTLSYRQRNVRPAASNPAGRAQCLTQTNKI